MALLAFGSAFAGEPRNLAAAKQEVIRYHDSGEYQKDLARVGQQALDYLKARVNQAKHSNKKLALVLDIDETSLSNYPDMFAMDFGGTATAVEEVEAQGNDPAILPTLELYQYAKAHHVAVFFITARREKYRSATEANLEKAGYKNWDGLYFLPMDYHEKSVTPFKTGIRKKLIEQGYDIVLSVSDQKADLRGGYADKAFKLPDPYYWVP
jgi:predicted secreted acid phosphatase